MAQFLDLQSHRNGSEESICSGNFVFGCELSSSTPCCTLKMPEEDDSDHIFSLKTISLLEGAKEECNIVEVVGRDYEDREISVPVANLKLSCQPWLNLDGFWFQPPVTFRLSSGSGPVHLAGQHEIYPKRDISDEELSEIEEEEDFSEEVDDDDEISEEEVLLPVMPAKKQRKS